MGESRSPCYNNMRLPRKWLHASWVEDFSAIKQDEQGKQDAQVGSVNYSSDAIDEPDLFLWIRAKPFPQVTTKDFRQALRQMCQDQKPGYRPSPLDPELRKTLGNRIAIIGKRMWSCQLSEQLKEVRDAQALGILGQAKLLSEQHQTTGKCVGDVSLTSTGGKGNNAKHEKCGRTATTTELQGKMVDDVGQQGSQIFSTRAKNNKSNNNNVRTLKRKTYPSSVLVCTHDEIYSSPPPSPHNPNVYTDTLQPLPARRTSASYTPSKLSIPYFCTGVNVADCNNFLDTSMDDSTLSYGLAVFGFGFPNIEDEELSERKQKPHQEPAMYPNISAIGSSLELPWSVTSESLTEVQQDVGFVDVNYFSD